uniref:Pro-cathepsin H n=1 Tax=Noccaea caerulescens TaxID=107243 RepID=A0A1J3JVS6_NOCCA
MPDSVLIQNGLRLGLIWDLHTVISVGFCNEVLISTAWRLVPSDEPIAEVQTISSSSSSDEEVGAGPGDDGDTESEDTSSDKEKEIGVEGTTSSSSEGETGAGDRGGSSKVKSKKKKPGKGTGKITITNLDDTKWPKDLPDNFPIHKDYREDGVLRADVTTQGSNEVCWAVCLRENIEATINIRNRRLGRNRHPSLSAQHLINNVKKMDKGAMRRYEGVENFLVHQGLVHEDLCPYTGSIGEDGCAHAMPQAEEVTRIRRLVRIKKKHIDEKDLIRLVFQKPVMVEMKAYKSLMHFKGNCIYRGKAGKNDPELINRHALLLIGYGTTEDGDHYWIVKNSYGPNWGEGGYGKIVRQCSPRNPNASSLFVKIRYAEV